MNGWLKKEIVNFIKKNAVLPNGEIELNRVVMTHIGAIALATALAEELCNEKFDSIGGLLYSAPLITAVTMRIPNCRAVYLCNKGADGAICEGDSVVLLANVAKDAQSLVLSAHRIEKEHHCRIQMVMTVLELNKIGGGFREAGYRYHPLISLDELS